MRVRCHTQRVRSAAFAVAVGAAIAGAASTAYASPITIYASPQGAGSACTQGQPCAIKVALETASSGDTVIVSGDEGSYGQPGSPVSEKLSIKNGVTVRGAPGQQRPEVFSSAMVAIGLGSGGEGQRLSDIEIKDSANSGTAVLGSGTIDHVIAEASNGGIGCSTGPATTIADSICSGQYGVRDNVTGIGLWTLSMRNDTIYAAREAVSLVSSGPGLEVTAVNTILHGATLDIGAEQTGGSVAVTLEHSNYATVSTEGGATITAPGSATNQIAPPLFVAASEGNLREASESPTIDAGVNDPANGETDLDGNQRTRPGRLSCSGPEPPAITDIGAYEFSPVAPPCPPPSPPNTMISWARVHHRRVTFDFTGRGSSVLGFECELDERPFRTCTSPMIYTHLRPGHYMFAVRAVGERGFDLTPARKRFTIKRGVAPRT
jgi:hypothetical protein